MAEDVVLFDRPAPHVGRLRINRPAKRNAIDHDVRQGFIDALHALASDHATRALVIGGTGGVFSAGGDVPSMVGLSEADARERMRHIHGLCRMLAGLRIPVVSAMEGIAAGGSVGMALLGDRIVVGPGTKVLFPFLRLGLAPDWGQLLTLPRRVGLVVAQRILIGDAPVSGEEAMRIGLADRLVADTEVMDTAVALAVELARLPQEAYARMKQRLLAPSGSLGEELAREENDQAVCLLGADFREGYAAFTARRDPDFIGAAGSPPA